MAEAPLPIEETIHDLSIDEHDYSFSDEEESETNEETPLNWNARLPICSVTLDSIAYDDCATMQEQASTSEKLQLNAERRDSSIGLILKQNHSKALSLLECMKPLPGDWFDVLFLMVECELRLKRKENKHLNELTNELLQSESVDCEDLLEWGNNLAFPENRLVGWIHLYDIARKKMEIKYPNQDKYAAWIVSPAHEMGLNVYDVLKNVKPFDNMLGDAIVKTMREWDSSLRYVDNQKLKHMSEIQCRVSSDLCYSTTCNIECRGRRIYACYRDLKSKYEDLWRYKVYCFVLLAMASFRFDEAPYVSDVEAYFRHCREGADACEDALDFISAAEREATLSRFCELKWTRRSVEMVPQ